MPKRTRHMLLAIAALLVACITALSMNPAWAMAGDGDGIQSVDATTTQDATSNDSTGTNDAAANEGKTADQAVVAPEPANEVAAQGAVAPEPVATEPAQGDKDEAQAITVDTEATGTPEAPVEPVHVEYRGHVQQDGWGEYVSDGAEAGTTGRSLRVEGLNIRLNLGNSGLTGGIRYRMHVQREGWMGWAQDDQMGGTEGRSLRVEAMQIELYGQVAEEYDVYYAVHAQQRGWMAWAVNGQSAGTAGQSLRLEAVKIMLVKKDDPAPNSDFVQYGAPFDGGSVLKVQAHVQRYGWMDPVGNWGIAGTTGQSLRMEALNVTAPGLDVPGSVLVDGHVQGIGWTGYNEGSAGTTGQSRRLEAIKIVLTGEAADKYDIYYRVHVAHLGWLSWAKNGEEAGTAAMSHRVECVQVVLTNKDAEAPSPEGSNQPESFITGTNVVYAAHCQGYGWMGEAWNGDTAGTVGESRRLEAYTAHLQDGTIGGGIVYSAYVAGRGWQDWKPEYETSGTVGESVAVEGIRVSLTGRAAEVYNVYYTTHVANAGWLGWSANGEDAGAPGTGHAVQAIQIRLVPKGNGAPGSSTNACIGRDYFDDPMIRMAQGYSSPTDWLIMVDDDRTLLGVFHGSQGNWSKYDMWRVSTGAPETPSVHGVFSIGSRGYVFGSGYSCYYWTEWNGPYLFHSIKYNEGTFDVQDGWIGGHISHGCIRMYIERAKWIYDVIPSGTTVVVY